MFSGNKTKKNRKISSMKNDSGDPIKSASTHTTAHKHVQSSSAVK